MKKYILLIFILNSSIISQSYESYLKQGIKEYKNNNNNAAVILLEKAKELQNTPEVNYYLGNVNMNLENYNKGIFYYNISFENSYRENDSLFNIACANSLLKNNGDVMLNLLYNYMKGDKNITRIKKDPDLSNFRNSKFYPIFNEILQNPSGVEIKEPQRIIEFLISHENGITLIEGESPNPPTYLFGKDGAFIEFNNSGGAACGTTHNAGFWKFDSKQEYVHIDMKGRVMSFDGISPECETEYKPKKGSLHYKRKGQRKGYFFVHYYKDDPQKLKIKVSPIKTKVLRMRDKNSNKIDNIMILNLFPNTTFEENIEDL